MTLDELLAAMVETAESDDPRTIAFVFNLEGYDAPRRVRRWLTGDAKPGADETLLILTRLGLLSSDDADRPQKPASKQVILRHRRMDAENATRIAAILEEHERYLEDLEGRLEELSQRLDAVSARIDAAEQPPPPTRQQRSRRGS